MLVFTVTLICYHTDTDTDTDTDTHTHTHKHTQALTAHSGASRLISSHWHQKLALQIFSPFQNLFDWELYICWLDAIRLGYSCETKIKLIQMI